MASHDIGKIGTIECQLAAWVPPEDRYQRRLVPLKPSSRVIPGSPDSVAPDTTIAEWRIEDFSGGWGNELWEEGSGKFHKSYAVQNNPIGPGLILGNQIATMTDSSAADLTAAARIVMAGGYVGVGTDGSIWAYPDAAAPSSGEFDAGGNSTGTASDITNMAAWHDGVDWLVSGHENLTIRTTAGTAHYNTGTGDDFTYHPVVCNFFGNIYALDGNDLYLISPSVTNTRTIKAQPETTNKYQSAQYLSASTSVAAEPWRYNRLTTSDVGPVWWIKDDNGKVYLYEYNEADDAGGFIGTLPGSVYPYDMMFDRGFYFVAYRNTFLHADEGLPYVYFQDRTGTTRGVIGPFLAPTVASRSYAGTPVILPGMAGDRLMVYVKGGLYGYDLSTGGIDHVAWEVSAGDNDAPTQGVIYGNQVMLANSDPAGGTANTIEKIDLNAYTTQAVGSYYPSVYTGSYDYGYPGIDKTILDVTVELQAGIRGSQSVSVYYKADQGTETLVGSMSTGSSNAVERFTVSTNSATVTAKRLEWVIRMSASNEANTPTLIAVSSRAAGAEARYEWILELDVSTIPNGDQAGWEIIDQLQTLKLNKTVVLFTDPWQQEATNTVDTFDVTVEEVFTPLFQADGNLTAQIRLRAVGLGAYVAGGGGYDG